MKKTHKRFGFNKHEVIQYFLGLAIIVSLLLTFGCFMWCYILIEHDPTCLCKTCEMFLKEVDNLRQGYIMLGMFTALFYGLTFELFDYFLKEVKKYESIKASEARSETSEKEI